MGQPAAATDHIRGEPDTAFGRAYEASTSAQPERDRTPVEEVVDALGTHTEVLFKLASMIEDRLQPLLRPRPEGVRDEATNPGGSQLTCQLWNVAASLTMIEDRLSTVLGALEV